MRGSSANQVTILIDGIPLNAAQTGIVNLGEIPLCNIEKIEIYSSNIPIELNTSPIGGVVNLITKKSYKTNGFIKLSAGSFETYNISAFRNRGNPQNFSYSYYAPEVGFSVKFFSYYNWGNTDKPAHLYNHELVSTTFVP